MSSFADDAEPNAKECSQMVKLLDDMRFMQQHRDFTYEDKL